MAHSNHRSRMKIYARFIFDVLAQAFLVACWCVPALAEEKPAAAAKPQLDLLVIAPHSDDEAIGCAAVMLQAIAQGERVGVVIVTASDGFPRAAAAVVKKSIDALQPADFFQLATIRERHTLQAMKQIGVANDDLMFLGYPDSGLATMYRTEGSTPYRQPFTAKAATYAMVTRDYHSLTHGQSAPYTKAALVDDLAQIIEQRRPREIYVTHEIDTHSDHRATFWFARDAAPRRVSRRTVDVRGSWSRSVSTAGPHLETRSSDVENETRVARRLSGGALARSR